MLSTKLSFLLSNMAMLVSSEFQAMLPPVAAFMTSINSVHLSCETDVMRSCTSNDDLISIIVSPILSSPISFSSAVGGGERNMLRVEGRTNDPFSDALDEMITSTLMLMTPEQSSGFDDVEMFFDRAVSSLFSGLASPSATRMSFIDFGDISEGNDIGDESVEKSFESETMDNAMWRVDKMAESANVLAQKILSSDDVAPSRRRLARRLTAVSPVIVLLVKEKKMNPSLAYGCHIDHCLWNELEEKNLSPICSAALETARATFYAMNEVEESHISRATVQLSSENPLTFDPATSEELESKLLKGFFFVTLVFLLILRVCFGLKYISRATGTLSRRNAVLRTVYENPDIKALVQEKLDEDIGDENYLSSSEERCFFARVCDRFCLSLPLFALAALLFFTSINSPGVVLSVGGPAIFLMMCYVLCRKACSCFCTTSTSPSGFELEARQPLMEDCTCCDCTCCEGSGMTVLNANGETSQVCCCCGGSKKVQNMDGSVVECPCCSGGSCLRATAGNDTGTCHNCDVATESCCGDCGCCLSCCTCDGVVTPFLVTI